jgi:hypothetical protein
LLPALIICLWIAVILAPALLFFFRLKQTAHGSESLLLVFGDFQMTIPSNHFFSFAFDRAGLRADKLIFVLDLPAKAMELIVSLLMSSRTGNWHPASLLPSTWRALTYPFYALPAWFYVGASVDALLGRRHVSRWNMILSLILSLMLVTLCCGLRFGISAAERQGQDLLGWAIEGLALWAILFSIPFVAWIKQRSKRTTAPT